MGKALTEAQRRNLEHVRDTGQCLPRSRAAYTCRIRGLTEFLWELTDGSQMTSSEVATLPKPLPDERCLRRALGERLTPAGRAVLEQDGGKTLP